MKEKSIKLTVLECKIVKEVLIILFYGMNMNYLLLSLMLKSEPKTLLSY